LLALQEKQEVLDRKIASELMPKEDAVQKVANIEEADSRL